MKKKRRRKPPQHADIMNILAENVRVLRAHHHWTQHDLEKISHVSRNNIGLIERGALNVGIQNVAKLAAAFGVSPAALLERAGPIPTPKSVEIRNRREWLLRAATDVLGSRNKAIHWIHSPSPLLGNEAPSAVIANNAGYWKALVILGRIKHGTFS
jgi:transcriptional regulator with XRE-family HTH domain